MKRYRGWAKEQCLLEEPLPPLGDLLALLEQTVPAHCPPQNTSSVEPYRDLVAQLVKENVEIAAIRCRLEERGYTGSYSAVRRFARKIKPRTPQATVRVERKPGEEAQVDFGYAGRMIDPVTEALRRYFSGAAKWILASSVGMLIGSVVAMPLKLRDLYIGPSGFQLDEVAFGAVFGILMGAGQWLALRTWVHRSGWWVLSSAVGWTLGMTAGELLPLDWNSTYASLVYAMVTESIPTAVTGIALVMLLRNALHRAAVTKKCTG